MEIKKKLKYKIEEYHRKYIVPAKIKGKPKIFCVGRNKTGTTSLQKAFQNLGYTLGNQRDAERLLPLYKKNNFKTIVDYCKSAEVFQDFPFSYPETFKYVDDAYPNSKFILSIRDSPEQWYTSLVNFHSKLFGKGDIPTSEQLQEATYVWKGFAWECNQLIYKTPPSDPYNKDKLISSYIKHNQSVINYFKNRPNDLLIINLSEEGAYQKLINFLGITSPFNNFPWENKTSEIPDIE